ncbi:2-oxo acid dehydrogenase subunit E2 [Clostridium scatologenes]|uniref:Branched-chain alpha-keto acid dehydrogenase subunit E2 n=1 Tax=Clostridium scatologenes TaxID=1548 RepID=A0A0E3GRJ2_CLOSL|nr:2-oxo acid dehydrogenase subunit E2 [Clostridium scatologenes]AKA70416.1 branched-chain alpha-keto acid dehydrogenase subunit E2 [Clostridium scatologenes]
MQSEMTQRDIMFRHFQMHKFKSESMVPTVAMTVNINTTQLTELKSRVNKINGHISRITITHIITKAVADTLVRYPILYSFFDGKNIIENPEIVLNIPVDTENHVEYIVIHSPELKSIMDISIDFRDELKDIRNGHGKFMSFLQQMSMDQSHSSADSPIEFLRQHYGNFVISNFGSLNIDSGSLALAQPMISGLCIGSITPIVRRKSNQWIEIMNLPITISFDHRAIDGAYVGKFLNEVKQLLENPDRIFNFPV